MAEEIESAVLEMLRRMRASQERVELDLGEIKVRLSSLEETQGQLLVLLGTMNKRMDRFDERMNRIERRFDLVDA